MAELKDIAEQLVNLSVKDVNELAEILKEEYGIEPAAAAVAVPGRGAGGDGGDEGEAKTEFDVVLTSAGGAKLKVIKEVKGMLGIGLKDAKDLVDDAPSTLKEAVPTDEAEKIKADLEDLGAEVELT